MFSRQTHIIFVFFCFVFSFFFFPSFLALPLFPSFLLPFIPYRRSRWDGFCSVPFQPCLWQSPCPSATQLCPLPLSSASPRKTERAAAQCFFHPRKSNSYWLNPPSWMWTLYFFKSRKILSKKPLVTSADGRNGNLEIICPGSQLVKFNNYLRHCHFAIF